MKIREWCHISGMTLTEFSKMVPCSQPYPGMIDSGRVKPGFKMACRIEEITAGLIPRTTWYPMSDNPVIGDLNSIVEIGGVSI